MEFDNDRIIKKTYKIELFYLALLVLINPLVNCLTIFPTDFRIWAVLLVVSLAVFPIYILYSRFIVGRYLFNKKYVYFIPATVLVFALILAFIYVVYLLVLKFPLTATEQAYFTFSYR